MKSIFMIVLAISAVVVAKHVCEPNSQFYYYCNICTCSEFGLSFSCTKMACDKDIWNIDGTFKVLSKNQLTKRSDDQQCTPKSQFKIFCNTCGCSHDGLSFACTKMMCDDKIWNQDGSLKVAP